MRITRRKLKPPVLALSILVGFSGCELDVTNPNRPDRARAIATPDDVETLISSVYQTYWGSAHYYSGGPAMAFGTLSNRHSASWGNFGMNDIGREPRVALPNTPSFTYRNDVFEDMWERSYRSIAAASDGLRAIADGLEIGTGGSDTPRAVAFGQFGQALAACQLAMWYDQAFIIDETVDLAGELETVPYAQMMSYAVGKFDEAIAVARGNSFTLEDGWINGNPLTNNEFADVMTAYKARCGANVARTNAEAQSLSGYGWPQIAADAAAGSELVVLGEDPGPWWDGIKTLGTENSTWHRMHYDWAGMADVSGNYQAWLATPLQTRQPVDISTPDQRYPAVQADGEVGLYHRYTRATPFPPERGTYRNSFYGDYRWDSYLNSCSFCWFGDMPELIERELRLYMAEAAFRTGDIATAVSIVNETRVGNGGLPPVVDGGTVPGGANCVPRKRYDVMGRCGDLRDALIFEHFEEVFQVSGGLEFFHGRRFDILPVNSALQLPIPAKDLETLQRDIYTFGGGGEGSATDPTPPPSIVPGDLDSSLKRAAYALERMRERAEELRDAKYVVKTH